MVERSPHTGKVVGSIPTSPILKGNGVVALKLKALYTHNNSSTKTLLCVSIFLIIFDNFTFFKKTLEAFPPTGINIFFLLSLTLILICIVNILLNLMCVRYATKSILIAILILSSVTAYFTDSYGTVFDRSMIQNIIRTDINEVRDLFTFKLLLYFLFFGILPSIYIFKSHINYKKSLKFGLVVALRNILLSLLTFILVGLPFAKYYTSFLREHKPLRSYTNPLNFIYSGGKSTYIYFKKDKPKELRPLARDAKLIQPEIRRLVIYIVGETARSDHFSLNGYSRETNPLLKNENVVSFSNMYSCGTSTATSLPCMFSAFGRSGYSIEKAETTENLLDALKHTGKINILWRDNNSDSKGVALRVPYEDYKSPQNNKICDTECRDEGMLIGLQDYINQHTNESIFIILHQLGNHGPAYYKRYPANFEKFKPHCQSNLLEKCSNQEIINAYDNALLYTDYFLFKVIELLRENSINFRTAMLYVSDHGESLGENGIYLHGLPYFMAPEEQKKVGAIMWLDDGMREDFNFELLKRHKNKLYSHDNLFHSILGLMKIETSVYSKKLDIFQDE